MPRFEPLSEGAIETIEAGVDRLAAEVGVRFDHPRALELFEEAGQSVEEGIVRFDRGFLRAQAALAPAEFAMRARQPSRDLVIGGDHMIFCPAQGPALISTMKPFQRPVPAFHRMSPPIRLPSTSNTGV